MAYTRKQIREITGLPDKTLRWLLDRLDIQPTDIDRTLFGSPVYLYDENALHDLHAYIFQKRTLKEERAKGKRCRGGCNRYLPIAELNSQQVCNQCRRRSLLLNEVCHNDPLTKPPDPAIIAELSSILESIKQAEHL
jgi:hypothetical protein